MPPLNGHFKYTGGFKLHMPVSSGQTQKEKIPLLKNKLCITNNLIDFFGFNNIAIVHCSMYDRHMGRLNKEFYCSGIQVSKKVKIRNQYNHVPLLAQDSTWESEKNTRELHIQASQDVSPFPAGDHMLRDTNLRTR